MSNNAGHDATEVGICLWANQICEQPNHHGCKTCLAVEPTRPGSAAGCAGCDYQPEETP